MVAVYLTVAVIKRHVVTDESGSEVIVTFLSFTYGMLTFINETDMEGERSLWNLCSLCILIMNIL